MTLDLVILALGFACGWWAHRRHAENRDRRVRALRDPARMQRFLDAFLGSDR